MTLLYFVCLIPLQGRFMLKVLALLPFTLCLAGAVAFADPPKIENVKAVQQDGVWRFDVTLAHGDTGWDDYADGWRILDMDGKELGLRMLHHPHVNEQPFTRSLSEVKIPSDLTQVQVEARDSVGGWSGTRKIVKLR